MANILTPQLGANALRTANNDPRMLDLLPQIDGFIQRATGRDWTQDTTKHPVAVAAATMLLVQWFENPGMIGDVNMMPYGLTSALTTLEAEALKYIKYQFYGRSGAGAISVPGACVGDMVISLVGIYGASGSQAASFEAQISVQDQLQQISESDLSEKIYLMIFKSPADDVMP